jgi:hypothetical protein
MARYRSFSSEFKRRRASSPSASPSGLRTNFPVNRHIKSIVRLHRVEAVGPASFQGAKRHLRGIRPGNRGSAVLHHPPLAAAHPSFPYEIRQECLRRIACGNADGAPRRSASEFDGYQATDIEDRSIWRFLPR